ncbi:MAG: anti-sigma factor [Bauldia sp.]
MTFDDETLMAFADGALDEPAFSEVAAAIETNPGLAARLNNLVLGRDAAKAAYAPLLERGVPAPLRRAVDRAIAASAPAKPRRVFGGWSIAAAAAVAVIVAAPLGYLLHQGAPSPAAEVGGTASPALAALIESVPSGGRAALSADTDLVAVATFTDGDGALCREVELLGPKASVVVACRDDAGWAVRIAVAVPAVSGDYLPAEGLEAVEAYLAVIEAGPPLSLDEERAALPTLAPGDGR